MGKFNLTDIAHMTREDVDAIYQLSREMKEDLRAGRPHQHLRKKVLAMYFEKPSLRTRCTFEIGMYQLGGHAIYLESGSVGLGARESVYDVAKNFERWVDLIMIRTFAQETVEELARHASVPVINALTDAAHPCQALADLFTVMERKGNLDGLTLTFLGDGNNICASLAKLCPMFGMHFRHAGPDGFQLSAAVAGAAASRASKNGGSATYFADPLEAVDGADLIYTDVWASMGQEGEAEDRKQVFAPYQVNAKLMARAPERALVMHDLPAHRGEEITDEVIDSPRSIVFDQAENRLHVQKGIMVYLHRQNNGD